MTGLLRSPGRLVALALLGGLCAACIPTNPPTVSGVSPTSGPAAGGTPVTVTGTNLNGATAVDFGTVPASGFSCASTSCSVSSPSHQPGQVDVTVTTAGGTSATTAADRFTYQSPPPQVTMISPTSGPAAGGTPVTVTGTNLNGATAVDFGTVPASGFSCTSTSCSVSSPSHQPGQVDVTVTTAGGTSATTAADRFTYQSPPPQVTMISPTSGPAAGGTPVTVTGTNLNGATAVDFGTVPASGFSCASTSCSVSSPSHQPGQVDVTVTTAGGTSATTAADRFTYQSPPPSRAEVVAVDRSGGAVTPVSLASGAAGTPVSVGAKPEYVAISPDGTTAYVTDTDDTYPDPPNGPPPGPQQLTAVHLLNGTTSTISVGHKPQGVAVTPNGSEVLVANGDGTISVVTASTLTVASTLDVSASANLEGIAVSPDGSHAYVCDYGDGDDSPQVYPISLVSGAVGSPLHIGGGCFGISVTPNGHTAYVTSSGDDDVVPIDLTGSTPVEEPVIPIGSVPQEIAISPDGGQAWIANLLGTSVSVIDTATNRVARTVTLPSGTEPLGVAVTPDGKTAWVSDENNGQLFPISTATFAVGAPVPIGIEGFGVAITPDQAPVASLTVTPAPAGQPTRLDASGSTVSNGTIAACHWDFGDGQTADSSTSVVNHVYSSRGSYTATVTETDSAGTSTSLVFTGSTVVRNGGPSARASQSFGVG